MTTTTAVALLTIYATQPFCLATLERVAYDYRIVHDPPDHDYDKLANPAPVAQLKMPSCSRWSGSLHTFCTKLSGAEAAWTHGQQVATSVDQALETTVAREAAAFKAKDQSAVNLQDGHMPKLERGLRSALAASASAGKNVAALLRAHDIGYRMTKSQCRKIITALEKKLARTGITKAQLEQIVGAASLQPRAIDILKALAAG
jgi:hypothetical protein